MSTRDSESKSNKPCGCGVSTPHQTSDSVAADQRGDLARGLSHESIGLMATDASNSEGSSQQDGNKIQTHQSMKTNEGSSEIGSRDVSNRDGNMSPEDLSGDERIKKNVRKCLEDKAAKSGPVEEHTVLTQLGQLFNLKFTRFGDIVDINKAIHYKNQAALLLPDDHADLPALLSVLGTSYRYRFERLGAPADIEQAISCQTQATVLAPANDPDLASWFCNLGTSYWSRSVAFGRTTDINHAIKFHNQAVALTPDGHANKPLMLNNLGAAHQNRFDRLGDLQDINDAIDHKSKAVSIAPEDHSNFPAWLSNLGNSYLIRYKRLGKPSDIETALHHQRKAVSLTPSDHPEMPTRLHNLGMSYQCRFGDLGELIDINNAIDCIGQALSLSPDGHVQVPGQFSSLGSCYRCRFDRTGAPSDINEAIKLLRKAVSLTPDGHASMVPYLTTLGTSYQSRYEHMGTLEDIEEAVKCYSRAVSLTDDGHPSRLAQLGGLGSTYNCRFEHLGDLEDINKAIDYNSMAVILAPDNHAGKAVWLNNLGTSYAHRFERLGERDDIEKAIAHHLQAVSLTPNSHSQRPDRLICLGTSYQRRFEHLGDIADIDNSIDWMQQAISIASDDHAHMPAWLSNLGGSYQGRFARLGDMADIEKSIDLKRQALALIPNGHSSRPSLLTNLGLSYQIRFQRLGEASDANTAILLTTEAVSLIPDDHEHKQAALNNLGISYLYRFESTGEPSDWNTAMDWLGQAIALTPNDHADRPDRLSNLGRAHQRRFERQCMLVDVEQAISYHEQAISLTPDGYAKTPTWLTELAGWYYSRFARLGRPQDIQIAINYFQRAAKSNVGTPYIRHMASQKWARLSAFHNIGSPLLAYERTMQLVPQVVWLGSTINQRFDHLVTMENISMEAASCAISFKAYNRALEWLEEGHSIVWNQILQLRTSFDDLMRVSPSLAERMKQLGQELEHAGYRSNMAPLPAHNTPDLDKDARHHRRLAAEWDQLLETTREIPGFADFMRARKVNTLMRVAKDGPVIIVNIHSSRCDALIIQPNDESIAHVPLGNFSPDKAASACAQLTSFVGHRAGRAGGFNRVKSMTKAEESFKMMLATLWRDVVKPVLDFLEYMQKPPPLELPHVTWCTTGALSFLPLHAAGCYDGSGHNAIDFVVSSYTPTLSALLTPSSPCSPQNSGVLAVGQQYTKGLNDLPNTVKELAVVKESAKGTRYFELDGANATVGAVVDAMDKYSWVHLACHASQNRMDPAQSSFHLHDGDLPLSLITSKSFKSKGLAFLSACQTATGDERLPNEAIHLAAGMLMAGYPSVIATMWGINDMDAPEIAQQVYADLLQDGKLNAAGAPRALHKAVTGLRQMVGEDSFERWVPFIHMGS